MTAYKGILDCDLIFSCVDRPVPRDILNHIAWAHLIPVVDGGIAIEVNKHKDSLSSAHWRAHIITPYHQCLRCNGQYNTSLVSMELDGSLDNPTYINNLPSSRFIENQNVFPFSLSSASLIVNLMLRYLLAENWWPFIQQQDYQFIQGKTYLLCDKCNENCIFPTRFAQGDLVEPPYLTKPLVNRFIDRIKELRS